MTSVTRTGVYYGYARISPERDGEIVLPEKDRGVMPMVMSLGLNPFYNNEQLTAVSRVWKDISSLLNYSRKSTSCMSSTATSMVMICRL